MRDALDCFAKWLAMTDWRMGRGMWSAVLDVRNTGRDVGELGLQSTTVGRCPYNHDDGDDARDQRKLERCHAPAAQGTGSPMFEPCQHTLRHNHLFHEMLLC